MSAVRGKVELAQRPWPLLAALAVAAAVLALLVAETVLWRPGWSIGDESGLIRILCARSEGMPWSWHWMQASLHQGALSLLAGWVRPSQAGLHALGWLVLVLEALTLYSLVKRWHGREAAAWAVAVLLLSAQAWMRYRTLLGYQGAPLAALGSLWLLLRVRGPWSAALAGALMGAAALEYETALLAMPFVLALAWSKEGAVRQQLRWILMSAVLVALAIVAADTERIGSYLNVRGVLYTGGSVGNAASGLGANLKGLLLGGLPLPYYGVHGWPLLAPWAWVPIALGLLWAARQERVLLAWAVALTLIPLSSSTGWGLPAHRLCGAAPAFAWLGGLGLWRLQQSLGRRDKAVLISLLLLGAGLEAHAWFRHMAVYGRSAWGRSALMVEALRLADAQAAQDGSAISTALYRVPYPELAYLQAPAAPAPGPSPRWVALVPAVLGWSLPPQAVQVRRSSNDEPVFLLKAEGPLARRFDAIESQLAPLRPWVLDLGERSRLDRAWMKGPQRDPWALDLVLERDLWALRAGLPLNEDHADALSRPRSSPGPETRLADYLRSIDKSKALNLYEHVLSRWPAYGPAIEGRVWVLKALGRPEEAEGARTQRYRAAVLAAWPIYD